MSNHQSKRKLMAMMLSVIMGVSLMPALASAEASTLPVDTRGELIAFETLEKDIEVQNVPFGTSEANLNLPDALTVTVRLEEALSDSDIVNESTTDVDEAHDTIRNAGAPSENKEESSPAEGEEEDTTVKDEMETATSNDEEEYSSAEDNEDDTTVKDEMETATSNDEEEYSPSEKEDKNTNSAEEITVSLPVTWYATPKYNSEASGTYVFTPNFSEGITVARGVEMPTISVTVGVATILAFDALPDDIRWQNTTSPVFPEALGGTTEDDDVQISVTWEADHDYDADYPVKGLYVFTAVLDEGYIVADGIELPRITVYIPQTAGRRMALMSRMAGGGTTDSPLEITTPAQLAEIAQLVNAGRLEAFLFNNSIDTIYLELKNDLNLFDYGASFHDGKGWTPIGTQANPFKGYFDGNGNKIEGLYIDDTSLSNAGLFGSVKGGMVQNLILTDANVRGSKEIGGIAGRIEDATIKNCGITGSVRGNENIGGIVGGIFENGTVEHCYTTGSVISTNNNAGGIAGNLNTATSIVRNCYSTSLLEGKRYIGGIAGYITTGTEIILNCAALNPSIHGQSNMGRVAGQNVMDALSGNVAYSGMAGGTFLSDASNKDGEDITITQIKADGTIGGRFTTADSWAVADGSLPGIGMAADMPPYMVESSDPFFPGEGTSEDPFQIGTAAQLAKLSEFVRSYEADIYDAYHSKHYKLTADIDLSVYNADNTSFNSGKGWIPIGGYFAPKYEIRSFSGVFDGDGHIIKGLYINSPSSNNCGLFGHVNYGTVINLGIVDAYINGGYNVGGISGGMIGTVENCFITGKINGASSVGGMIGDLNSSTSKIINCYSAASVSGNEQVGGFIGRSNMGCVINSYSTGAISGEDKVGGIIGFFYGVSGSEVKNCAALNPSVRGSSNVSRMIGLYENNGVISGNYAYAGMKVTIGGVVQTITDGTANNIKGLAKTANELQSISGFPSVFSSAPWTYIEKKLPGLWDNAIDMPIHLLATDTSPFGGGDGTSEAQAYEISTAAQLAKLAELVSSDNESIRNAYNSKYYKLTNDIDLSAYGKNYDNGKGWLPIGRKAGAEIIAPIWWFRGTFDGNGKVITGLYINRPDEGFVGLFGYAMGAKIINIAVVGANVYGDFSVGGIAGIMSNNGTIQNCYVSGTISGDRSVGGIVGHFNSNMQQIKNCRSDASVIGNRDTIGGIVAITYGKIENCYATGLVSGGNRVGGIAGEVKDMYAYVRNCVALNPAIIATGENAGRVAGISSGQLINNYAFSGMKVNGTIITGGGGNNNNGADLSISKAHTASFWSTASNWDFFTWNSSPWAITDNKLPILTAVPASIQSGDSGVYLTERDMAYADCSIDEDTFTYNGSPQIPALTVTFDGTVLVQDVDYAVDITSSDGSGTSAGTKVGQVTLTISGKGNFKGETEVTYTILPKLLHNDMLSISGDSFVYTGTPHTPAVTIINDIPLISGIDYVVSYSDNINAGEATVIVAGIGNYSGTPNTTFTIQKAAAPSITWPTATNVTYGTALSESTLSGGSTEYGSFAWKAPKTIPTVTNSGYEVVFTPSADTLNNYEPIGETSKIFPITVTPKDIAELTVNTIAPITYTGTAQTPVTIKHGSLTLVLNKDYTATYSNNVNVGEATVVIEGKGNYIGSQSLNFTIAKRPITIKADNKTMIRGRTLPDFTYTVDGQLPGETALVGTPVLTCTADGKTLGDFPITLDLTGVSYTANYEAASPVFVNGTLTVKNPSSDSSGGDSSSISGGATISSKKKEPHQPVTSETSVTATLDQNGVAHANISDNIITFAITKAQVNAKKQGKATNSISVNLNVTIPKGTNSLSLTLSNNAIDSIVNAGVTNLTIHNGIAPLVLDREALKEIQKQSDGTITITIHPVQNHSLSEKAKKLIGTRPVYDITVTSSKDGKNKNITSLGKGSATLALPYTPNENEAIGYLFGVYVDDNGNATRIPDSAYDAQSGSILMNTTHFSIYGVGYESPSEKYTDAATHWAKESIDYVVGRGLFSGTTDVTFSPDSTMNRGMLITVLGRLSGADVSSYTTSSFADVAVGKYYQPYIQWAYKKGIISTLGNGNFEPERPATREEIALMLQNYANATSYKLPVIHKAIPFADASSIGDGYNCAVTALQQAGIMIGDTSNKLNPKSSTTRAEISSMLHRYIKLTIDPATAHGWALNDMGQYLYYKNGKALTGTQTIDGAKYFFNTDGTLKTGWVNDGDNWRYYNGKKLLTGWQSIGSNSSIQTYYFDTYGTMVSGKWQQIDDTWYYFHADGSLAKNTTIDGYNVDDTGARKNK